MKSNESKTIIVEVHFSSGHQDEYPMKKSQLEQLLKLLNENLFTPFFCWEIGEYTHRVNLHNIAYIGYEKE